MPHQATQPFYITREDGTEEFVPKGKVFPDGHDYVVRDVTHTLFEELQLNVVAPKAAKKAAPATAPAKATPAPAPSKAVPLSKV